MFRFRTMVPLAVGYAAGYVAGAKAGRPAYDRLRTRVEHYADSMGLTGGSVTAADLANDEVSRLRTDTMPGRPDEGREHGPIVVP